MGLRLHTQFLDALAALAPKEQKRVRVALRQLAESDISAGLRPHPVGDFMSFSATMDLRILAVKDSNGYTLVHVDHHDDAYQWGERHCAILEPDGLLLAVLPSDVVQGNLVPAQPANLISQSRFAGLPRAVASVLDSASDTEQLLEAIAALSPEWQEMALALSNIDVEAAAPSDIIAVDDELLQFALALPAEKWRVFLHPAQRAVVDLPAAGSLLLRGGPGTGKTICLVHRYVRLSAITPEKPPILVAINDPAREALEQACIGLGHVPKAGTIVDFGKIDWSSGLKDLVGECSAVLIDEGQDLPVGAIARVLENLERDEPMPPLTIAYDPNQAIVEPSGDALVRLQLFMDATTLTYCYRMSSEILQYSSAVLQRLHTEFTGKRFQDQHHIDSRRDKISAQMTAVITGPDVEQVVVDEDELEEISAAVALDLHVSFGTWDGVGVVVVGDARSTIEYLRERGVPAHDPASVKGLEFFRGIIVDRLPAHRSENGPLTTTAAGYRAQSGLYVAMTRFRDSVILLTPHQSRLIGDRP